MNTKLSQWSLVGLLGLLGLMLFLPACSMTGKPPNKFDQTFMDVKTNYVAVTVLQTNVVPVTTLKTNEVTVTVTNAQQVLEFRTNVVVTPMTVYETNRALATNMVEAYSYTPNVKAQEIQQIGGTVGNFFGLGGAVSTGLALLFGVYARMRSSKLYATSTSLADTIETMRQFIKQLPQGTQYDQALVAWMQKNQAQAGVLDQVLQIVEKDVSTGDAKLAAEQLHAALHRLTGTPPETAMAPKVSI